MKWTDKIVSIVDSNTQFDDNSVKRIEEAASIECVNKIMLYPDFHFKKKMEFPSSTAVETESLFIPDLSSSTVNCGMGCVITSLSRKDFDLERQKQFYSEYKKTRFNKKQFDLRGAKDIKNIMQSGASMLLERHSMHDDFLKHMEFEGNILTNNKIVTLNEVNDILRVQDDESVLIAGEKNLGLGIGGNHFIELQYVYDILNINACSNLNIVKGQINIMYHGGGGIIPWLMGAYYSNREKMSRKDFRQFINKLHFHFKSVTDFINIKDYWNFFFSTNRFDPISLKSETGRKIFLATQLAMNYGYAYRLILIARIQHALKAVFGEDTNLNLLVDQSHNTIEKTMKNEKTNFIHRHNSTPVKSGAPVILPGFNSTSSYIGVGLDGAKEFLSSMPHGCGASISEYMKSDISSRIDGRFTNCFNGEDSTPQKIGHITDEGCEAVIRILEKNNIFKPIAKCRPIAVLKNYHY